MTANRIIHHIFNQPDLRQVDQASLEQLVEKYPYFAAARMLLAKKEFTGHRDLTAALQQAQLYGSTPLQVYQFMTGTFAAPEAEVTPVQETAAETVAHTHTITTPVPEVPEAEVAPAQPVQAETAAETLAHTHTIDTPVTAATETAETPVTEISAPEAAVAETAVEPVTAISEEDQAILDELAAEDARNAAAAAAPAPVLDAEDAAIAAKYDEFIYDEKARTPATAETAADDIVAIDYEAEKENVEFEAARTQSAPDAIVAIDYEAEKENAEFEAARTQSAPDAIVAIDYEAEKENAEFEAARTQSAPDAIVAIDYEAEKENVEFEAARTQSAPDDIIAIDYEAIREETEQYEPEPEDEEIIVATAPPEGTGIAIPPAAEEAPETGEYEPEPEDEEIVVATATPEGAGIAIPPAVEEAPETEDYEPEPEGEEIVVATATPEGAGIAIPPATEEAATEETPIRIHPMDTPVEETVLTFQPLYTEDYFAYKKLKDPNSAEMMTDKAAAEMRSFTDWLREIKDNFAGKATKDWYHQQLNRLYEDEEPEVSERVEKMAMESITLNDDIVSETLAEIWVRQHQHGKAIAVYQKLSLLNPDKNAYFAQKIKDLQLLTDNNK